MKYIYNSKNINLVNLFQFLAIKCNSDPTVIKVLAAMNASFDCASMVSF